MPGKTKTRDPEFHPHNDGYCDCSNKLEVYPDLPGQGCPNCAKPRK